MEIQEGSVEDIKRKFREKSIHYRNFEKLSIAKSIYLDGLNDYSPLLARDICYAVDNINEGVSRAMLTSILHVGNKTSKKVFEHVSGLELPKTNKGVKAFLSSKKPIEILNPIPYTEKNHKDMKLYCYLMSNGWYTTAYGVEDNVCGLDIVIRQDATGGYNAYSKDYFNFLRYSSSKDDIKGEVEYLINKFYDGQLNLAKKDCALVLKRHLDAEKKLNAFLGYEYDGI